MKKLVILIVFVLMATPVFATLEWTNNGLDNDFANLNNWYEAGTTTVPAAITSSDNVKVQKVGADKAVISSATVGRQLQVGWDAGTSGLVEVNTSESAVMSSCIYLGLGNGSTGTLNVVAGMIKAELSYTTLGGYGTGYLNITDNGQLRTDRIFLGNKAGSKGELLIKDSGYLRIATDLKSVSGDFTFRMEGSDATVVIMGDVITTTTASKAAFEFALNGASGVERGVLSAGDITLVEGTTIDLSFLGEVVNGTYSVMKCRGTFSDLSTSGLLSAASIADGWSYEIVSGVIDEDNGLAYTELQVTIPEPAMVSLFVVGSLVVLTKKRRK